MAKTFHLTVARVGENLFDGEALSVTLPGSEGVFTVMSEHEALVSPLAEGLIQVKSADGSVEEIAVTGPGIAEVSNNQATILL